MLCPVPIIRLARAASTLPSGSLIELLTDDPAAEYDVPAWCRLRGHELVHDRAAGRRGPRSTPTPPGHHRPGAAHPQREPRSGPAPPDPAGDGGRVRLTGPCPGDRRAAARRPTRRAGPAGRRAAGTSTAPSEARCSVHHWTSMTRRGSPSAESTSARATTATFEASVLTWNFDSAANSPPTSTPNRPPARRPSAVPDLDRVRPAQSVQLGVGGHVLGTDPPVGPPQVGTRGDDLGEGLGRC